MYGGKNLERKKMKENTKSHTRNVGRLRKTGHLGMSGSSFCNHEVSKPLAACSVRNVRTQGDTGSRWCEFQAGVWAGGQELGSSGLEEKCKDKVWIRRPKNRGQQGKRASGQTVESSDTHTTGQ